MMSKSFFSKIALVIGLGASVSMAFGDQTIGEFLVSAKNSWGEATSTLLEQATHDREALVDVLNAGRPIGVIAYFLGRVVSEHLYKGGVIQHFAEKISQKMGVNKPKEDFLSRVIVGGIVMAAVLASCTVLPKFMIHNFGSLLNLKLSPETMAQFAKTNISQSILEGLLLAAASESFVIGNIFESKNIELRKRASVSLFLGSCFGMLTDVIKMIRNIKVPAVASAVTAPVSV